MTGIAFITTGYSSVALADTIESLVMPGPLSAAHAELESECSTCHAAFSKTLQRDLCLACHEHRGVLEDQATGRGFHGLFAPAGNVECSTCHTEHEGRDADIVGLDVETFDHRFTDFELKGSHPALACEACHSIGQPHRETPSTCVGCHEVDDAHQGDMGAECSECHDQKSWQSASFDHDAETDFPLTGAHAGIPCALCHASTRHADTPTECHACHRADDAHGGLYGTRCEDCHGTSAWNRTTFDHLDASGFALTGRHAEVPCAGCHSGSLLDAPLDRGCASCHQADDVHQGGNGVDCAACHDSRTWKRPDFDHAAATEFPLQGAHAGLACQSCHRGEPSEEKLETECIACHRVNDVHEGTLGEKCERCHEESSWNGQIQFDHDLGSFPLIGLHAVASCEACHSTSRYSEAPGECADCHAADDVHGGSLGSACGSCHNPNDWELWEFDHDTATDFPLAGAHIALACESCHDVGGQHVTKPPSTCFACHRGDDVHRGQFGRQCARCHDSNIFGSTETIQ